MVPQPPSDWDDGRRLASAMCNYWSRKQSSSVWSCLVSFCLASVVLHIESTKHNICSLPPRYPDRLLRCRLQLQALLMFFKGRVVAMAVGKCYRIGNIAFCVIILVTWFCLSTVLHLDSALPHLSLEGSLRSQSTLQRLDLDTAQNANQEVRSTVGIIACKSPFCCLLVGLERYLTGLRLPHDLLKTCFDRVHYLPSPGSNSQWHQIIFSLQLRHFPNLPAIRVFQQLKTSYLECHSMA